MNDTNSTGQPAALPGLAEATGSAAHHLIEDGWEMRADDEALDSDCASWWRLDSHPSARWMIGAPYTRQLFVPIRRAGMYPYVPNKTDKPDGQSL